MTLFQSSLRTELLRSAVILGLLLIFGCSENIESPSDENEEAYDLANIDLSNWKVTLPIGSPPVEVTPPAIWNFARNAILKPFMYNDSTDASIVFYTYPGSSTANSSYSRTELREQMVPGSNSVNWTFSQGGTIKGTLSVPEVSSDEENNPHRVIIMQIHGRLTNEQRDLIGEDDNNAPPVLKIYLVDGRVRVKTKVLKDLNVSDKEILKTSAWTDDEGKYFSETVGKNKFTLEVKASEGRMEVTLNENETFVYDGIHMDKWGVFENYFKAGNYLVTTDNGAYSKVKYYNLEVSHE
ncbi:polysaccharide lyase family 7 protein [Roseivirga sp.]|uniref:polysaccharide lyase family 7 protein n=1 Tax=Roseivirga sp. TaxID=1964215 RepID=UPI003B8E16FC